MSTEAELWARREVTLRALRFDPSQPRDGRGRWINLGDVVDLPGGKKGKVVGVGDKDSEGKPRVKVKDEQGNVREVAGRLVTKADHGGKEEDEQNRRVREGDAESRRIAEEARKTNPIPERMRGGPKLTREEPKGQRAQVDRGVAAIASTHSTAPMPEVPVRPVDPYAPLTSGPGTKADGYFSPPTRLGYGRPVEIGVSESSKSKGITFVHEYGHAVDFLHLAGGNGTSLFADPPRNALGAAAMQFNGAARRSATMEKISGNLPEGQARDYWTSPEEMWARAYAQYVAEKSGDPQLKVEVQNMADQAAGPQGIPKVWGSPRDGDTDSDWPPVRDAVERVLKAGGLLE